jgi:hypothetical protein
MVPFMSHNLCFENKPVSSEDIIFADGASTRSVLGRPRDVGLAPEREGGGKFTANEDLHVDRNATKNVTREGW